MTETKIIVIDDDPTGSQTVHGCLLLTRWDVQTLTEALRDAVAVVLRAQQHPRHECGGRGDGHPRDLRQSARGAGRAGGAGDADPAGHRQPFGQHAARALSGRDRRDRRRARAVRRALSGARVLRGRADHPRRRALSDRRWRSRCRCIETEFARDSVFGFSTAFLPDYVEEKTAGRIAAEHVERFGLADVRGDIGERLRGLERQRLLRGRRRAAVGPGQFLSPGAGGGGRWQTLPVPQCREPADGLWRRCRRNR